MSKKIKLIFENKTSEPRPRELSENIFKDLLDLVNIFGNKGPKPDLEGIKSLTWRDLSEELSEGVPESLRQIVDLMYPTPEKEEDTESVDTVRQEVYENILSDLRKFGDPETLWDMNVVALSKFYANVFKPDDPILDAPAPKVEQFSPQTNLQKINDGFPTDEFIQHMMNQIPQGLMPGENSDKLYFMNFNAYLLESIQGALEAGLDPASDFNAIVRRIERKFRDNANSAGRIKQLGVFNEDLPVVSEKPERDSGAEEEKPDAAPEEQPDDELGGSPEDSDAEIEQPEYGGRKVNFGHYGNAPGFGRGETSGEEEEEGEEGPSGSENLPATGTADPEGEGTQGQGIPIYKFQSRDAAGPDGKRTQPLASKLMKAGLPKSIINTVIKSIVKDLKASNVPFYESKEQLTNVLKEHIIGALSQQLIVEKNQFISVLPGGKVQMKPDFADKEDFSKLFSDSKKAAAEELFDILSTKIKNKEDTDAIERAQALANNLGSDKALGGNLQKQLKVKLVNALKSARNDSTSGVQRDQKANQIIDKALDKILGDYFAGPELTVIKDLATSNATGDSGEMIDKEQAKKAIEDIQTSSKKEVENRTSDGYRASTSDAPDNWLTLGTTISEKPQVMGKSGMKKNIYKNINWRTAWAGTATYQYRDGLSRKEKELWLALTKNIETAVKGAPYPLSLIHISEPTRLLSIA